jgi:hypothetical protein
MELSIYPFSQVDLKHKPNEVERLDISPSDNTDLGAIKMTVSFDKNGEISLYLDDKDLDAIEAIIKVFRSK